MTALLESLQTAFHEQLRSKTLLDQAIASGLPNQRSEQWKYTSLRALSARRFVAPTENLVELNSATKEMIAAIAGPRMVFVNSVFDAHHSDLPELSSEFTVLTNTSADTYDESRFLNAHDVFAKLNTAVARQGFQINADNAAAIETPMNIVFVSTKASEDLAIHYRHKIALGENTKLTLVEHHISQESHQNLLNHFCEIFLGNGAELTHARIQQDDAGAHHFLRTEAALQNNAIYHRLDLELGSHLSRHDLQVKLLGDGATIHANGSLIANGKRHIDTRLDIQHTAKNTACHLLWRGLATDRSRAVFHGGILIEQGADGAEAHLSNKNLLLSDQAEIDTQPVLVIHADEVIASHGATVGRLDDAHLFYLRARGIPETQAKAILTTAFCKETLHVLENNSLIDAISPQLERALSAIELSA